MTFYQRLSAKVETRAFRFTLFTTLAVLVGGLVEIPPFFIQGVVPQIPTVKPYSALELTGRDVYQSEGCFYCHTQMIRPFKWETDRWDTNREYGPNPYSLAGESAYDHPFLWGSKRTGPDLSHEASLRNNAEWQKRHLIDPRETSPGSVMPSFAWMFEDKITSTEIQNHMKALRIAGVPYSNAEIADAPDKILGQTKGDAVIAYLLKLGRDIKLSVK